MEAALRPGAFIKYGAGWSFVEGLEHIRVKIAAVVGSSPARAVVLYESFLAGSYEKAEEIDDSSGNFGTFVGDLFQGWVEARQAAGADPNETAGRLLAWMDDDPYGYGRTRARNEGRFVLLRRLRPRKNQARTAAQAGAR